MPSAMFTTLILILSIFGELNQQIASQTCGIPVNPPGAAIDPARIMGRWYEFMYRTTGIVDFNAVNTYTPIARALTPDNNQMGIATNWTISFFVSQAAGPVCTGIFGQSNFSTAGKKTGDMFFPGRTGTARAMYTVLFTDYNIVEIAYRCNTPSITTNNCNDPWFFINTRTMPPQLDQATRTYISNTVNTVLRKYCLGTQNLSFTGWNLTLPACNQPPPAGFATLISNARVG